MLVVDLDNYDGELTDEDCIKLKRAGVQGAIVGLQYPGGSYPAGVAHQQIPMLVRHGIEIVACYQMSTPIQQAWERVQHLRHLIPQIFVDVEEGHVDRGFIDDQLDFIDQQIVLPFRAGIYTAAWFWQNQEYAHWFGDRDLWAAQYDENYDVETFQPVGDWQVCKIKQVTGTAHIGRLDVDLNVMR